MFTFGMLLSCIFITNSATTSSSSSSSSSSFDDQNTIGGNFIDGHSSKDFSDFDQYAVTCYICVNVSNNLICNQFAIDRPCKPGETFCHTLHIMDSKGTSILVNKKCTTERECQKNKVGCVAIDTQMMCISCCDQDYCNANVPTNSSTAIFDNRITNMRTNAMELFNKSREKVGSVKDATAGSGNMAAAILFKFRKRNNNGYLLWWWCSWWIFAILINIYYYYVIL